MKEKLSNFLPDLPGMIDLPGSHDNSSLRSLIEKPPILGGSFNPITGTMLAGFRLHTGPVRALLGRRGAGGRPGACPPGEVGLGTEARRLHDGGPPRVCT